MNNSFFNNHIYEYKDSDDYLKFRIIQRSGYSFLILIHRNKTVIDLYEEIDLRLFNDERSEVFFLYFNTIQNKNKIKLESTKLYDFIEANNINKYNDLENITIYDILIDIEN